MRSAVGLCLLGSRGLPGGVCDCRGALHLDTLILVPLFRGQKHLSHRKVLPRQKKGSDNVGHHNGMQVVSLIIWYHLGEK